MKKKVIIFDLDGVLFDSIEIAERHLRISFPGLTQEMQKEILTGNFHEEISKISLARREENEEEKEFRKKLYEEEKTNAPMYEGIKDLIKKLHNEEYIIALNTSARVPTCMPCLEVNNIQNFFDFIGTAEVSKSKVEKFKIIKDKYNVESEEMLFVTDTLGDLKEADIASVPTVCVTWGAHDETYFLREPHKNLEKIVNSVEELEVLIKSYN